MKVKTAIVIVVYSIVIIAVFGTIALIFAFVNNGQQNFYVQYGGEKISYKVENKVLPKDTYSLFYCKKILGITDKQEKAKNFTVSIVANEKAFADHDFSGYTVDGKAKDFFRGTELTKGMDIQICDGYFMLYLPDALTLQSVLEKVYPDSTVKGVPEINLYEKDYLQLVVYSEEEKATVTIGFH